MSNWRDPLSWVVIYHTHFGSFGDIVEALLKRRQEAGITEGNLTVVSDASRSNRPKDTHGFQVTHGYCAMHARRNFAILDTDTPTFARLNILAHFAYLYRIEALINSLGRTFLRTQRLRLRWGKQSWLQIKAWCEHIVETCREDDPLTKAAQYVIAGFTELTWYLANPTIMPDNGLPERYIRPLRVEENGHHGLETERGRVKRDIIRSIMAVCRAIGLDFDEFLEWACQQHQMPPELRLPAEERTPKAYLVRRQQTEKDASNPAEPRSQRKTRPKSY